MADLIVKAGRVYAIDDRRSAFRSFAVRDGGIVAVSEERDERRLPTATELDRATASHPVLAPRGEAGLPLR